MKKPLSLCWRWSPALLPCGDAVAKSPSRLAARAVNWRICQRLYCRRAGAAAERDQLPVMRTDQRRYFGHPDLIQFIQRTGNQVQSQGMGTLLIGDMGMPAGGRFNGGHASHQSGLDVDIFLQLPQTRWSSAQLLKPQALDLVARDGKRVVPSLWSPQISHLIKLAAEDNDVTRIFVNPAIKQQLCLDAGNDRGWLRKVRPWFQHRAHMHVRLRCPAGSLECEEQAPPPPGDGCGAELQSWFEPQNPEQPLL